MDKIKDKEGNEYKIPYKEPEIRILHPVAVPVVEYSLLKKFSSYGNIVKHMSENEEENKTKET